MISLFYLLIYLLKKGRMPGLKYKPTDDSTYLLNTALQLRQNQKADDICYGNSRVLRSFLKEVCSYQFKDAPNYDHLRAILEQTRTQ